MEGTTEMKCIMCGRVEPNPTGIKTYYCDKCKDIQHRVVRVMLTPETMLDVLSGYSFVLEGIPKGCRFISYYHNPSYGCFDLYIEHESFDRLVEGQIVPYHNEIVLRRKENDD